MSTLQKSGILNPIISNFLFKNLDVNKKYSIFASDKRN